MQAEDALHELQHSADAVICFENDKMGDAVAPKAGIHQAFANADQTIGQSVRAISELCSRRGLIHIGFDDLVTALRSHNSRCVFGFGEADGDNRAHDALARALKNPLMDRGAMLSEAENILVNVSGGTNMTLNEVQILMEELGRHINDESRILFGTTVDAKLGNRMSVTIISSIGVTENLKVQSKAGGRHAAPVGQPVESEHQPEAVEVTRVTSDTGGMKQTPLIPHPEEITDEGPKPPKATPRAKPVFTKAPKTVEAVPAAPAAPKVPQQKQETLQFEPVTRGRFEKSEPTIVDGQDLDVPTFMRRNVKVK
jgi:cell division protein FtsZ